MISFKDLKLKLRSVQMMGDVREVTILEMANVAVQEQLANETGKLLRNIFDPNTEAKAVRTLTIKLTFKPDENRESVSVSSKCESKLAANKPIETTLFIDDRDGAPTAVEYARNVTGQLGYGGSEEPQNKIIKLA